MSLPREVARSVARYLAVADRLLDGRICGFYVVGSVALGAFRPSRSDVDFVAVVDGRLTSAQLRRLRLVHLSSGARTGARALAGGHVAFPGTCNGVYVAAEELALPVTEIRPLASHTGVEFERGGGFDVNPVVWKVLAERGIAVRGPAPATLPLDPQPDLLRRWTRQNLDGYWRRWGAAARSGRPPMSVLLPTGWVTSWGVLGAPRLHRTLASGDVISKEGAGEYALEVFDERWHPIVREGLAFWRGEQGDPAFAHPAARHREAGSFVLHVVEAAGQP